MAPSKDPPLDEVQWRAPPIAQHFQGIHSNSVLFYFAESPFFDPQSNNGIYARQAQFNPAMAQAMWTREQFENVLSQMPNGTEFRVAHAPADMVTGTGVWVIVKQERERGAGVTPIAHYFVVGENVYQAPTFGDMMSAKMELIADSMSKVLPLADSVRTWTPSSRDAYRQPPPADLGNNTAATKTAAPSKEATPMPTREGSVAPAVNTAGKTASPFARNDQTALDRLAEESFHIHMRYGGDYIDENPITGRPGEFHLSSTGRKDKLAPPAPPPAAAPKPVAPPLNTKLADEIKREGKPDKSPRTPGAPKPKRRKSKMGGNSGGTNTAATTPQG